MREYAETFCPIDHASIDVKNIAEYTRFFENVFGMKVWRVKGPAESPDSRRNYQEGKKKSTVLQTKYSAFLVENSGIEPLTSCMPCKRSPEPRTHAPPHKGAGMIDIRRYNALFRERRILTQKQLCCLNEFY